jgi:DNA polymerase-3 subunit beta|tara:strand:- start:14133 stop:15233 length:1101 start_codon:yes stop_codon:yes gene_type:complete
MKFTVTRDALLKPLNLVAGVVERRQTLPILANVLIGVEGNQLTLTGTDLEVELLGKVSLDGVTVDGDITVPARKLLDIVKSLPDDSVISVEVEDQRAIIKSGRSRFTLSTLPASEFPNVEQGSATLEFDVLQGKLKGLIDKTAFAMAQQDVRYYLNGMLWEIKDSVFRVVATDGHRLALSTLAGITTSEEKQVILPRKGVLELSRLLIDEAESIHLAFGDNHLRATTQAFTFTSKLVDGKFPDYDRVLPKGSDKEVVAQRDILKQALARAAILSNEKYRGIRMQFNAGDLRIVANNPEQEEAEDVVAIEYDGDTLEIGFNVSYLLDIMNVVSGPKVKFSLLDANSSALLEDNDDGNSLYVVMPMRL